MEDFDDISQHVTYGYFYVDNNENNYRLHVDQFSGAVGKLCNNKYHWYFFFDLCSVGKETAFIVAILSAYRSK